MQIWRAEAADDHVLAQIRCQAILGLVGSVLPIDQAQHWVAAGDAERFMRVIRDHVVWIASEATAMGWVEADGDRIAALYIALAYAGCGIGSALLTHAKTTICNAGYTLVQLEASQNALGFLSATGLPARWPIGCPGCLSVAQESGLQCAELR